MGVSLLPSDRARFIASNTGKGASNTSKIYKQELIWIVLLVLHVIINRLTTLNEAPHLDWSFCIVIVVGGGNAKGVR